MMAVALVIGDVVDQVNRRGNRAKPQKTEERGEQRFLIGQMAGEDQSRENKRVFDPLLGPES